MKQGRRIELDEASSPVRHRPRWFVSVLFGLLIGTVAAVGFQLPGWWRSASAPAPIATSTNAAMELRLFNLLNAERVRAGCPALQPNAALQSVARNRAQSMKGDDAVGHVDSHLRDPQSRAAMAGYRARVVESTAVGLTTPEDVMATWLNTRVDRAIKERLDDCSFVTAGVGYSTQQVRRSFGPGVWILVLGSK